MPGSAFASLLWPRFVIAVGALLLSQFAWRLSGFREIRLLVLSSAASVLASLAAVVLSRQYPALMIAVRLAGDVGATLALVAWSGFYRQSNRALRIAGVCGAGGLAVVVLEALFGGFGFPARLAVYLTPPILFLTFGIALLRIDQFSHRRAGRVLDVKPLIQVLLLMQTLAYLVVPARSDAFGAIVAALPLAIPITLSAHLIAVAIENERGRVGRLNVNIGNIFTFLSGVGRSLGGGRDPEMIVQAATETLVRATDADAAVGVLLGSDHARVVSVVGVFPPPVDIPEIVKTKQGALQRFVLSLDVDQATPLWGPALENGGPVHIPDASSEASYAEHAADRVLQVRSVLVLPLTVHGQVLGLLSVVRRGSAPRFTEAEFSHAATMAEFVAVTLDNYYSYRLQRDVEIAGDIQQRLQAPTTGVVNRLEYAGVSRPARGVSGDYYDVIPLADGRTAVIICDVAGKGVPAALVMVMVRTIAHLALRTESDAGTVLGMINHGVSGSIELDRFATASVVVLDPAAGRLSYANAGHHPAMIVPPNGDTSRGVRTIDADGLPIGIDTEGAYPSVERAFPAGSTLVLFTDGIVEAFSPDGEVFGEDRLSSTLSTLAPPGNPATVCEDLLYAVLSRVDEFVSSAPQHDDMTMLVCCSASEGTTRREG